MAGIEQIGREQNIEQDRFFRYSRVRYFALGPMGLEKALQSAKKKLIEDASLDEEGFWDLFNDLKSNNKWETAEVLAFLDLCSFVEVS